MTLRITGNIDAQAILRKKGLEPDGAVQRFLVNACDRYMIPYMPFRAGMLMKNRVVVSDGVHYNGPYARYLYMGKVMVNAESGKGPALIPGVGFRYPKGAVLRVSNRDLAYDTTKNFLAGPFWDVRMWEDHKGDIMAATVKMIGERG